MSEAPYTLYGMAASLYTGKVRAYMRHHGIPFEERGAGHAEYGEDIVPKLGRFIVPAVVKPDGSLIQDGTDILDYFEEKGRSRKSIYPEDATLRAVAYLFELFGGEGLLRPAMHYRWNFDADNLAFIKGSFDDVLPGGLSTEENQKMFEFASGRMRQAAVAFGVVPDAMKTIEETYTDFLKRFDAHLAQSYFLLGGHATIGDYGLFNPLFAHLGRDPHPAMLMKQTAPRVFKWLERMNGPETFQDHTVDWEGEDLFAPGTVPETLKDLMRYVAEEYLPEITAHVDFANNWLAERPDIKPGTNGLEDPGQRAIGMSEFNWRGHEIKTMVMPYRFYLLQRLTDCVDQASHKDQKTIRALFAETGLEAMLGLRTTRRVERLNHLEVWGE